MRNLSWNQQICTKHAYWDTFSCYWKWRSLTVIFKFILTIWLRFLGNSACPLDNSSQIKIRITKFAPNMHPGLLSTGFENGGHWLWSSRSFLPFWLRILGNLACPQIWARTKQFAPNMHLWILSGSIENGGHRPWLSRTFGHFNSRNGIQHRSCILVWAGQTCSCYK